MNTMVGMQASLHTPTEDSLSDLMKNEDPNGLAAVDADDLDLDDVLAGDEDDFNPDDLLKSPLFEDEAEFNFGSGGAVAGAPSPADQMMDTSMNAASQPQPNTSHSGNLGLTQEKRPFAPMGLRRSDAPSFGMKQREIAGGGMMVGGSNGMGNNDMNMQQQQSVGFQQQTNNSGMDMGNTGNGFQGSFNPGGNGQQFGNFPQMNSNGQNSMFNRAVPGRSNSNSGDMLDVSQGSAMSSQQQQNQPMFGRSVPQRSQTFGGQTNLGGQMNQLQMMQQQMQGQQQPSFGGGNDGPNELQMMQAQMMQMNDGGPRRGNLNDMGQGGVNQPPMRSVPGRSFSSDGMGGTGYLRGGRRPGGQGGPGMNELQAMQAEMGRMSQFGTGDSGGPVSVNDAMEKLAESMKRSAMSRSLVKKFSTGGPRGIQRSNSSDRMMMMGMQRRAGSARNSMSMQMDDSSTRSLENRPAVPLRRLSNAKHSLPQRGVMRHRSDDLGSMVGMNNRANGGMTFQIDTNNFGPNNSSFGGPRSNMGGPSNNMGQF